MRKNKFINMMLSMTIAASSFVFTTVYAASEPSIQLYYDKSASTSKVIKLEVLAKDIDEVTAWQTDIKFSQAIEYSAKYEVGVSPITSVFDNVDGNTYRIGGFAVDEYHNIKTNGETLASITIEIEKELQSALQLSLCDNTSLTGYMDNEHYDLNMINGLTEQSITIPAKDGSTTIEKATSSPSQTGMNSNGDSSSLSGSASKPTAIPTPTATPKPTATPAPTKAPATAAPQEISRPAQMNKPAATENPDSTVESADDENPEETEEPTATPKVAAPFEGDGGEISLSSFADTSKWAPMIGSMVKQDWISLKISGAYGNDYVAKYKGVPITSADFNDMINGYNPDVSAVDIIANLSIEGKFGTTIELAPVYAEGIKYYIVDMKSSVAIGVYKITLDPDGGICSDTVLKTSENKLKTLPTAEKEGYVLIGWTENGTDIIFEATEFSHDTTLKAMWDIEPEATPTPKPAKFEDLGDVAWAAAQINALANLGILNGKSENEFAPNESVTRAEFTKMICAALKITPDKNLEQKFEDVPDTHWAFGYVTQAAKDGIVNGVSDNEFAPGKTITRQEMAAILYRAVNAKKKPMPQGTAKEFADKDEIAEYAKTAVEKLSAASIINGVSETEFAPKETATRAQAAVIIYQYFMTVGIATIFD